MLRGDFSEEVAEIGGDAQVAALVELLRREAGPAAVHLTTIHRPAHCEEAGAVAMVGAAVAVLPRGAAELAHRRAHRAGPLAAHTRGNGAKSETGPRRGTRGGTNRRSLVRGRSPPAALREGDFNP